MNQNLQSLPLSSEQEENRKANWIANRFFLLAVIFGLILIFLEPPFVGPDENAHFVNICRISRGGLFADVEDGKIGCYISDEELNYLLQYGGYYNGESNPLRFSYQTMRGLSLIQPSDNMVFFATEHATLNPTPYLLAASFVAMMRAILGGVNAYHVMLYSKLINLVFYALVIRWALRKTGAFRKTMFLMALMPMAIFQGASTSYDATLIPAAFLLFAYVTKILTAGSDYRITREDLIAVCFSCGLIFGVKVAYVPLVLILLSIGLKQFGGWKRWGICVGAVAGMGVVFYLIPNVVMSMITSAYVPPQTEMQLAQKAFFAENWTLFPKIIWDTVKTFGKHWCREFIGVLGWLDVHFPEPFTYLFMLILGYNILLDACQIKGISRKTRLLSPAGVVIFFVGTIYTMYMAWNPVLTGLVGGTVAYGGQGRYFIPVALFVLLAFSNGLSYKLPGVIRERLYGCFRTRLIEVTAVVSLCCTVLLIMARYWM